MACSLHERWMKTRPGAYGSGLTDDARVYNRAIKP